jgi:hypothetical protein
MRITFDVPLTDSEQSDLATVFDCKKPDVPKQLELYGKAALIEYVNMFLGRATLRTAADAKEFRLLTITQNVFGGRVPDDDVVGREFHLTSSQARALTRTVLAKYALELAAGVQGSYAELIRNATKKRDETSYRVSVRNRAVVDGLNQMLLKLDPGLPPILQKPGTSGTFLIDPASYQELAKHFGIQIEIEI